jgi:hypothetical protein
VARNLNGGENKGTDGQTPSLQARTVSDHG